MVWIFLTKDFEVIHHRHKCFIHRICICNGNVYVYITYNNAHIHWHSNPRLDGENVFTKPLQILITLKKSSINFDKKLLLKFKLIYSNLPI